MKPRMSVARCCCDAGETSVMYTDATTYWWDEEQLVDSAAYFLGANNVDNSTPWGVYKCNQADRWTNVAIPQGATITSATLYGVAASNNTFGVTRSGTPPSYPRFHRIKVRCHDHDNSPAGVSAADWEARARTTAGVDIDTEYNGEIFPIEIGPIDATAAVQEVVNRPGWSSGNALTVIYDDDGSDEGNEGTASRWGIHAVGGVNELHVTYTP